jgi:signal peptidase I
VAGQVSRGAEGDKELNRSGGKMREKRLFWTILVAGCVVALPAAYFVGPNFVKLLIGAERQFSVSSISMEPTLRTGERFLAEMSAGENLKRGDVVIFKTSTSGEPAIFVQRIAALPGDEISLQDGVVVLNGKRIEQKQISVDTTQEYDRPVERTRLEEQFPGERRPHQIYDTNLGPGDNFSPVIVPADHVFLLGDNRDNSADSRFEPGTAGVGVGMVNKSQIIGKASKISMSGDTKRIGMPIQ